MANDMKENNYFSHYKPGTTIPHGLLKARVVCNAPAENLVQTSPPDLHNSRVAFNAWMQATAQAIHHVERLHANRIWHRQQ